MRAANMAQQQISSTSFPKLNGKKAQFMFLMKPNTVLDKERELGDMPEYFDKMIIQVHFTDSWAWPARKHLPEVNELQEIF